MNDDMNLKKILKWAGLAALVAVPVYFILKKRKSAEDEPVVADDADIFAPDLQD